MIELVASLMAVLVVVTISSAVLYYKQIRKIQAEYEKARSVIEDVVLSFNRELRKEADRTELVAYKVEGNAAKADNIGKRIDTLEKTIESVKTQAGPSSEKEQALSLEVSNINSRISGLEALQETVKTKVSGIEEEMLIYSSVAFSISSVDSFKSSSSKSSRAS